MGINQDDVNRLAHEAMLHRERALASGRTRAEQLFGKPMIEESANERSAAMADVLERRKKQLEGYSAEENTALRDAAARAVQRQRLAQERSIRSQQAAAGITGGLKLAQQRAFETDALRARQEAEKNLFLQNIAERQRALGSYETSLTGAEETETSRYGRRQAAKLATELGYGQMASSERAGATQAVVGEMQAASAANQGRGGGGGKK